MMAERVIFDITNSKDYLNGDRDYYNGLAANCVELLDDLLILIERTPILKQLEYRYVNLLVMLRFVDVEYGYLKDIVDNLRRTKGQEICPVELLMHLKNYLVHIDSFIDYLDGFLEVLDEDGDIHCRFDRKAIQEFELINETRNQIHHESLPTVDYNHYSIASAHADLGARQEVYEIRFRWPLTKQPVDSIDLDTLLRTTKDAVTNQFEKVIMYLKSEMKNRL
ncbi:hypothetical protein [Brevibacillus sp. FIR094]|uniref:hypothetical protein n=1 Tax=Brevibacillus sp. FIR094 TaxID=3134809 RepID=UPI003D255887